MVYSNLSKINKACVEHTLSQITPKKAEYKKYADKLNHLKTINHDILLSKLYTYIIYYMLITPSKIKNTFKYPQY